MLTSFLAACSLLRLATAAPALSGRGSSSSAAVVNQTTCNGQTYAYNGLAGYGFVPGTARDKFGDTIGGIGSAIAVVPSSWTRAANGSYTGVLLAQPDRGWNTNGTLNYQARVHKFNIVLTPAPNATASNPSPPNLQLFYLDSTAYTDPNGTPTTGLDGDFSGHTSFGSAFPDIPLATYSGDGFGGPGSGGQRVPVDAEGLIYNAADGSTWTSDEYGPYIYRFDASGRMVAAIRPPDAFIPLRNGSESFSAASAPAYDPAKVPNPSDPTQGRANNQGFEGMALSPDGRTLSVLLQSALIQDGGTAKTSNYNSRLLQYDISSASLGPKLVGEYVVRLPTYTRPSDGKTRTAAQSEIHDLGAAGQFLVLARDSGAGRAADSTASVYRHADVFDISGATNLVATKTAASNANAFNASVASSKGVLKAGITPATYCPWLDFNVDGQLARFGLHNGGADDPALLNEKWESLAVVPQLDGDTGAQLANGTSWFVISLSDDDFITQDGYLDGGNYRYKDATGASLDNQALVFDVTLPAGARPFGAG